MCNKGDHEDKGCPIILETVHACPDFDTFFYMMKANVAFANLTQPEPLFLSKKGLQKYFKKHNKANNAQPQVEE